MTTLKRNTDGTYSPLIRKASRSTFTQDRKFKLILRRESRKYHGDFERCRARGSKMRDSASKVESRNRGLAIIFAIINRAL